MEKLESLEAELNKLVEYDSKIKTELIGIISKIDEKMPYLDKKMKKEKTSLNFMVYNGLVERHLVEKGIVKKLLFDNYDGEWNLRGEQNIVDYVNSLNFKDLKEVSGKVKGFVEFVERKLDYKFKL
jgi:hypothetical protein